MPLIALPMKPHVALGCWLAVAAAVPVAGQSTATSVGFAMPVATPPAPRSDAPSEPPGATDWAELTRRFDRYVARDGVVGGSMVLVEAGRITMEHHRGYADVRARRPVDRHTVWHYGSITKTLTAIAVMQQVERGRLTLDEPVTRRLPELRTVHDPFGRIDSITVRMLLSHTSGFQDPTWPYRDQEWQPFEPTRWEQLVAMMPYQRLHFVPGSRFGYSNPAFIYLARILEQLSGEAWQAYVQKHMFMPLGLGRSYFGRTPPHLARHRSHGYEVRRLTAERDSTIDNGADFDPGITIPNGGWNAPLDDLARYLGFLTGAASEGTEHGVYELVLPRRRLEEMWQPLVPVSDGVSMGLSFFRYEAAGLPVLIGHTGTQGGFRSFLYFNPDSGAGAVAVFNSTHEQSPGREELSSLLARLEAHLRGG